MTIIHQTNVKRLSLEAWLARLVTSHGDTIVLVARLALAFLFFRSGFELLADSTELEKFSASLAPRGVPAGSFWAAVAMWVQLLGGLAIILGFWTRSASLVLIGFIIAATVVAHRFWELEGGAYVGQKVNFECETSVISENRKGQAAAGPFGSA